jgi:hypothetical protein
MAGECPGLFAPQTSLDKRLRGSQSRESGICWQNFPRDFRDLLTKFKKVFDPVIDSRRQISKLLACARCCGMESISYNI